LAIRGLPSLEEVARFGVNVIEQIGDIAAGQN
jgi:hypothetical protein